jgi:hypothetical protein
MITIDPVSISVLGIIAYQLQTLSKKIRETNKKGSTDTPIAIGNQFVSGSTSSTSTDIIKLRVPAGWYYEFTGSGVTFSTATPFAEEGY